MISKYRSGQDPYCYPGTEILINKFNIKDNNILQEAEREITTIALNNISFSVPPYDLNYLKDIHRVLFYLHRFMIGLVKLGLLILQKEKQDFVQMQE